MHAHVGVSAACLLSRTMRSVGRWFLPASAASIVLYALINRLICTNKYRIHAYIHTCIYVTIQAYMLCKFKDKS